MKTFAEYQGRVYEVVNRTCGMVKLLDANTGEMTAGWIMKDRVNFLIPENEQAIRAGDDLGLGCSR